MPALGLLEAASSAPSFRVPRLPEGLGHVSGVTALLASGRHVAAVVQTLESDAPGAKARDPVMLVFDRDRFTFDFVYTFRLGRDVHSACVVGDTLYAVSTGTDEVIAVPWRGTGFGPERVVWRPAPDAPREDVHHLNAILHLGGDVLVSGFGAKAGAGWASARQGFIYNVTRGEMVLQGVDQPHSLFDLDGKIGYCESRRSAVRVVGDPRSRTLPGYSRGAERVGEHLFVATSIGRSTSAEGGCTVDNPAVGGVPAGRCTVSRLSVRDFRVEETTEIAPAASEIYDLLAVEDAGGWPTWSDLGWRDDALRGLAATLDDRDSRAGRLEQALKESDATLRRLRSAQGNEPHDLRQAER